MQTLKQILSAYCTLHNKEMPYDRNLMLLGKTVIDHLWNIRKADFVKKGVVTEEFEVNHFPDELLPHVNEIIERYFQNTFEFLKTAKAAHKKYIKEKRAYFRFFVEQHRCEAFERACQKSSVDFVKGDVYEKGKQVIYFIPHMSFQGCINLGVLFQKLRTNDKYGDLFEKKKAAQTSEPAATTKRKRIKKSIT